MIFHSTHPILIEKIWRACPMKEKMSRTAIVVGVIGPRRSLMKLMMEKMTLPPPMCAIYRSLPKC